MKENSCELTSCGEVSVIYVAIYYWNVMKNMFSIYVATAGIVMRNCAKVCTSIDKHIYSVLQTAVHFNFLPIIISLTLHGQIVPFSPPLLVIISTHSV